MNEVIELKEINFIELSENEMMETEGGVAPLLIVAAAGGGLLGGVALGLGLAYWVSRW